MSDGYLEEIIFFENLTYIVKNGKTNQTRIVISTYLYDLKSLGLRYVSLFH
jgi:hypothetical protein